jgi:hypothetical protein
MTHASNEVFTTFNQITGLACSGEATWGDSHESNDILGAFNYLPAALLGTPLSKALSQTRKEGHL